MSESSGGILTSTATGLPLTFITHLCSTPTYQLVVRAVVSIALNTRTVPEFVGDDATLELLRELGVD